MARQGKKIENLFFCDTCRAQIGGPGMCRKCLQAEAEAAEEEEEEDEEGGCNEDYDRWDYYGEFGG